MKKVLFFVSFCLAGMWSYSQVTTDPKKKSEISTVDNKVKTPRLTPLCFGKIAANGTLLNGTKNVTVTKHFMAGRYFIKCDGITAHSIILITINHRTQQCTLNTENGQVFIMIHNGAVEEDSEFHFLIYEPG